MVANMFPILLARPEPRHSPSNVESMAALLESQWLFVSQPQLIKSEIIGAIWLLRLGQNWGNSFRPSLTWDAWSWNSVRFWVGAKELCRGALGVAVPAHSCCQSPDRWTLSLQMTSAPRPAPTDATCSRNDPVPLNPTQMQIREVHECLLLCTHWVWGCLLHSNR